MDTIVAILEENLIFLLRIMLAALCGALIGIEREHRTKVAGLRTHILISIAASLMMIISKYGFLDALSVPGTSVDISRVAAGIITGVGILSGGIIFIGKRGNVSGITTAAGIWATIGIGMAIGAGMYVVGIGVAILVEIIQNIRSKGMESTHHPYYITIILQLENGDEPFDMLEDFVSEYNLNLKEIKWERKSKKERTVRCVIRVPARYDHDEILKKITSIPEVVSCNIASDE
ncbi:MAG: MgtC/SapB family protein [Lachnospiraceae bacterium]|nr:MgtC/SapB family protein [Lachnospiraceae bacterium]